VDNTFRQTDDLLVFDLSASYPINGSARVYGKVDNVFDEREIVSRKPDGARGNKPRTLYVGIKIDF
jgi:Fe(3+) dicitrate transport protein